jgi:hypothetical protein
LDSFEFVQIAVAIVLGFGISEILAGWGQQLRHRETQPFSSLQLVASAFILMWAFRYLWIQWSTRPEVWDYPAYLLTVTPAVLIALAAHSIRFDPMIQLGDQESLYERSRKPVCWLLACVPAAQIARGYYILNPQSAGLSSAFQAFSTSLIFFSGFLLTTLVFLRLATTGRPRDHWIGWIINWAVLLVFFLALLPELSSRGE